MQEQLPVRSAPAPASARNLQDPCLAAPASAGQPAGAAEVHVAARLAVDTPGIAVACVASASAVEHAAEALAVACSACASAVGHAVEALAAGPDVEATAFVTAAVEAIAAGLAVEATAQIGAQAQMG